MKILLLRAHFGKLNGELTLHGGMNLLHLPNEAGKSTWSAFITAMLYGIDTKERRNTENQGLPVKERYQPWDGGMMEGTMEVEWDGRCITLERTSTAKTPMGVFRAYDTASGAPIAELTAENCGRTLCGVERSVFERTAFIRQLGLPVTGDPRLEQRLGALVSTGEESGRSYSEMEQALRSKKNQLVGRAGRLPALQKRESELKQALDGLREKQEHLLRLREQREAAAQEKTRLAGLLSRIARAKVAKNRAVMEETERQLREQEIYCSRLEAAELPDEALLQGLQSELHHVQEELQTAKLELAFGAQMPEAPTPPPYFDGLTAEEAKQQSETDAAEYRRLTAKKQKKTLPWLLLGIVLLLGGAGLCLISLPVGAAAAAVGAVGLLTVLLLGRRNKTLAEKNAALAEDILTRYGAETVEELPLLAEHYAEEMAAYEAELETARQEREQLQAALTAAEEKAAALIEKTTAFAPGCATVADCRTAITAALRARDKLASERRTLENLRRQSAAMQAAFGDTAYVQSDVEALTFDEAKLEYEHRMAERRLSSLTVQTAELQGAIAAVGDAAAMEAELERVRDELETVREHGEVVELALWALKSADELLRSRFSPQITAETGRLLAELTDGKYSAVLLEPDLKLSVREENGVLMRPAAAMSCGTADQMYLALRLAMCHRLLPEGAPLILDDALVNFDETRTKAALKLLFAEAEKRQVILFTCREIEE